MARYILETPKGGIRFSTGVDRMKEKAFCIFKRSLYNRDTGFPCRSTRITGENRNVFMTCPVRNRSLVRMEISQIAVRALPFSVLYGAWSEARPKQYLLVKEAQSREFFFAVLLSFAQ